jgi:cellobiose phosphorylase
MAWTHAQLEMHHLRIQAEDGQRFQQLASHMLYPYNACVPRRVAFAPTPKARTDCGLMASPATCR